MACIGSLPTLRGKDLLADWRVVVYKNKLHAVTHIIDLFYSQRGNQQQWDKAAVSLFVLIIGFPFRISQFCQ